MLLEQKTNLAKAHQNKYPSSPYTYKQVHSSVRDGDVPTHIWQFFLPIFCSQKNLIYCKCFSTYILQENPVNGTWGRVLKEQDESCITDVTELKRFTLTH